MEAVLGGQVPCPPSKGQALTRWLGLAQHELGTWTVQQKVIMLLGPQGGKVHPEPETFAIFPLCQVALPFVQSC